MITSMKESAQDEIRLDPITIQYPNLEYPLQLY